MSEQKKKNIKKKIISCVCFAAVAAGTVYAPAIPAFKDVGVVANAATAEEPVEEIEIDLSKITEYGTATDFTVEQGYMDKDNCVVGADNNVYVITLQDNKKYKISGTNLVNVNGSDAYVDVQIYVPTDVTATAAFNNATIVNDEGTYAITNNGNTYQQIEGNCYISNIVVPFNVEGALTVSGTLRVDTYAFYGDCQQPEINDKHDGKHHAVVPIYRGSGTFVGNNFFTVDYLDENGLTIDSNYYLSGDTYNVLTAKYKDNSGEEHELDLNDFPCISTDDKTAYNGLTVDKAVSARLSHSDHDENGCCTYCGEKIASEVTFETNGGSAVDNVWVTNGDTISAPAAPTASVGQKFSGWYTDESCTTEYDFSTPITADTTIYAGYEDCSVSGITISAQPSKTEYNEGEKFDPTGLEIEVTYDDERSQIIKYADKSDEFTFSPTLNNVLTTADTKITITYGGMSAEQAIKVTPSSSGGSSGGSLGGSSGGSYTGSSDNTTRVQKPSVGGSAKSWSDIATEISASTDPSEITITLNGITKIPENVIKAIADTNSKVTFVIDGARKWIINGSDISDPAEADLTFIKTSNLQSDGLRGIRGTRFTINDTGIPASIEIAFKTEYAGKFANLYKSENGELKFITCAKAGADGKVILSDVAEKGEYAIMLCDYSDRPGDMNNDGVMNINDAESILDDIVGFQEIENPVIADFNDDGTFNVHDAAAILRNVKGLE